MTGNGRVFDSMLRALPNVLTDGRARGIESGAVNGETINVYKNYLIPQRVDCGVSNIKVNAAISTAD